jgi:hypothetical protein
MFCAQKGADLEWYPCPACGGAGVRIQYGAAEICIRPGAKRARERVVDAIVAQRFGIGS